MRKILFTAFLTLASAAAGQKISLNGDWLFKIAPTDSIADLYAGFHRTDYDASHFDTIAVPSNWALQGFEEPVYKGKWENGEAPQGFYIYRFETPEGWQRRRTSLDFGGVWDSCDVWLNGKYIDRHESGFTSFSMNVTDCLNAPGKENILAVRVYQNGRGYLFDVNDDWSLGGIYRDVTLSSVPRDRWIESLHFTTELDTDHNGADLVIKTMVGDRLNRAKADIYKPNGGDPYKLRFTLTDAEGNHVATATDSIDSHAYTGRENKHVMRITSPGLWTAETPYLYDLKVELIEHGDSVAQTEQRHVGFREISTDGGVLKVNGMPVHLRGVNRHDEWPTTGRATSHEHWLHDLKMMKKANINFVRACHYQHAKGFIEMCDSLGMYVGAEVGIGGGDSYFRNPTYIDGALLRTYETVRRDQDNPSVIYWSVGNEDDLTEMHLTCVKFAKSLDPTRPVMIPWRFENDLPEEIDLLSIHYWTPELYERWAANAGRPIISTEWCHAYGESRFGGLDDVWKAMTSHPAGAGGAVWMWADQGLAMMKDGKPTKGMWPSAARSLAEDYWVTPDGWDGITRSDRTPTADFYETKEVYLPVYPESERVNADNDNGFMSISMHNDYSFTDMDAVRIGWSIMADGRTLKKGIATLAAAPQTSAMLRLPASSLTGLKRGETPYVRLTVTDADGDTLGHRTVEIDTKHAKPLSVKKKSERIVQLLKAMNLRPCVWHKLNDGDLTIKRRSFEKGANPEIFRKVDTAGNMYEIDGSNKVEAVFDYKENADGSVTVSYRITPHMDVTYLPVLGVALDIPDSGAMSEWFGWGPGISYPNKHRAQQLGLHDASCADGTRHMRWLDVKTGNETMRISAPYGPDGLPVETYFDRDDADSTTLRILSRVLGRSEKGRLAVEEWRLYPNRTYEGSFTVTLK